MSLAYRAKIRIVLVYVYYVCMTTKVSCLYFITRRLFFCISAVGITPQLTGRRSPKGGGNLKRAAFLAVRVELVVCENRGSSL